MPWIMLNALYEENYKDFMRLDRHMIFFYNNITCSG